MMSALPSASDLRSYSRRFRLRILPSVTLVIPARLVDLLPGAALVVETQDERLGFRRRALVGGLRRAEGDPLGFQDAADGDVRPPDLPADGAQGGAFLVAPEDVLLFLGCQATCHEAIVALTRVFVSSGHVTPGPDH